MSALNSTITVAQRSSTTSLPFSSGTQLAAASASASTTSAAKANGALSDEGDSDNAEPINKASTMTEAYMNNLEDALLNAIRVRNAVLRENENLRESLRRRHLDADQAEFSLSVHLARAHEEAAQAAATHAQARATLLAASGSDPELRERFITMHVEKEAHNKTLSDIKEELNDARSRSEDLRGTIEDQREDISSLEDTVTELEEAKEEVQDDNDRLLEENKELLADAELAEEELQEAHELRRLWRSRCRQRDSLLNLYRIPIPSDPVETTLSSNQGKATQQQSSSNSGLKRKAMHQSEAPLEGGLFEIRLSNGVAISFNKRSSDSEEAEGPPPKTVESSHSQQQKSRSKNSSNNTNDKGETSGDGIVKAESNSSAAHKAGVNKVPVDKHTRQEHLDALCEAGLCAHK